MNRSKRRREDMRRFATIALALGAGLFAGCGEDDAELPQEGTLLEYTRAGGLAFSIYEVTIDADGTGTAAIGSNVKNLNETEFELSDEEVSELRTILEEHPISSFPDRGNAECADCFEYTYAYGGDEITVTDVTNPLPELDDLRDFLAELSLPEDQPNGG